MTVNQPTSSYPGWEELKGGCDSIEALSVLERREARKALQLLEEMFGPDFLEAIYADGHPIGLYLLNRAPWTRRWLIHFAEVLRELPSWENHQSLQKRLRDGASFDEALSVLEAAHKFSSAGFRVFIDPSIQIEGKRKKPDLKVRHTSVNTGLFVEVSALYQSHSAQEAHRTSQTVFSLLLSCRPNLHYSGRLFRSLAPRHLNEVQNKVDRFIQESRNENRFRELLLPKEIELAIAPDRDKSILENWAHSRGLEVDGFSGSPFDNNQIARTRTKIKNESPQLPPGLPNILVIENNDIFTHGADSVEILNELEEEVYRHPNLLFMVLCGRGLGEGENVVIREDGHLLIQRKMFHYFIEQQMVVLNRFCDSLVCQSTIQKLQAVFTGGH